MDGTTASPPGSRALLTQLSLILTGVISLLMLASFGGQLVVAPVLLPLQWLIARRSRGAVSLVFSVLGALLIAEVTWIGLLVAVGVDVSQPVGALALLAGFGVGALFFNASRPKGVT